MGSFGRLWPQISARRAWDQHGRPVWEVHFTPRSAQVTRPEAQTGVKSKRASGKKAETVLGEIVDHRGVQLGDLAIDEHRYRIVLGGLPAREGTERPDVAAALAELAVQPENEVLRRLVAGRLAAGHDGFPGEPGLDISSARITGQGLGELFDGVFVWRAQTRQDTFTFVVAPDLQARALLIEDPELARALIQLACPRPGDRHGAELENRLQEAISRLGVTAAPGRAERFRFELPDPAAVLRVRDPLASSDQPVQEPTKSESEMALSAELADLARKVGVRAVRRPSTS
jgi:hypothetical protein